MRNHTTAKFHELTGPKGKAPVATWGATPQSVQFNLTSLPTSKDNKFWYYVTALWIKCTVQFDTTSALAATITEDIQYQLIESLRVQCPILGEMYSHSNTRGSHMGNIIQYMGYGYNAMPRNPGMPASATNGNVTFYFRVPFSYEFLRKPHETSPWTGFLEGGTVEIRTGTTATSTGIDAALTVDTITFAAYLSLIPCPEAVIHTPIHWRIHDVPFGNKLVIPDMGSPDGLQGVDQSRGVGLGALLYICNREVDSAVDPLGLGGNWPADRFVSYDIPFRDQDRVDVIDAPFNELFVMMGNNRKTVESGSSPDDAGGFPYDNIATTSATGTNSSDAMVFPFIAPGRDLETSKLQTIAGAKQINATYDGATSLSESNALLLGLYFPQFDEQFAQSLASRIKPGSSGELVAKTLNKQSGGIPGVGKLAYVRQKVK